MLDLTKPLQTRDGRPVTLITTQGREPWPLVGYVGSYQDIYKWEADGGQPTSSTPPSRSAAGRCG